MIENTQVVYRKCDMCDGKGKIRYGGFGDDFIYECPMCDGSGHKR